MEFNIFLLAVCQAETFTEKGMVISQSRSRLCLPGQGKVNAH